MGTPWLVGTFRGASMKLVSVLEPSHHLGNSSNVEKVP